MTERRASKRAPRPPLRPFVEALWSLDEPPSGSGQIEREHVLPTGRMHVVFRLSGEPLRVSGGPEDATGRQFAGPVVGGARASYYAREVSGPLRSVGAQLRPGAAQALFGPPADELAGRHTALADLWGKAAGTLAEQLAEAGSAEERLDRLEAALAARLPRARALHPAVAEALERLAVRPSVRDAVRLSGYSHRTFVSLFRRSVGLSPKRYCRVRRFQQVLRSGGAGSWADLAAAAGYSDQAHLTREFQELAGMTPTQYRRRSPASPHHVPLARER